MNSGRGKRETLEVSRAIADLFMQLSPSGKIVMLSVIAGVFGKWAVDDFRGSRTSAITWILLLASLLGFALAVTVLVLTATAPRA
jgi:hypothetical protein